MTIQRMIELLEIEQECVKRNGCGECNRFCAECDLLQDDTELHEMYAEVIALIKAQKTTEAELNLCASCMHEFGGCGATGEDIVFGCGVGNDNVIGCARYVNRWKNQDKDAAIIRKCREGKVLKHVGNGVVVLNFDWWRKMIEKCGHIKVVPSVEDLLKAQEPRVMGVDEVWEWVRKQRVDREPICVEVKGSICAWIVSDEYWDIPMDTNLSSDLYDKTWRCWTSRPDEKRRAETPWESVK